MIDDELEAPGLVLGRRRFLRAAAGTAALATFGEWSVASPRQARAPRFAPIALDDLAALDRGNALDVTIDGSVRRALIVRLSGGELVAYDGRCPHLGCPVRWSSGRNRFECPCHGAAFDGTSGEVLFGPPAQGLTPLRVVERGGGHWLVHPDDAVQS
jgi:nitrite reductase/ring-hydroxylating ferredoxin subunit